MIVIRGVAQVSLTFQAYIVCSHDMTGKLTITISMSCQGRGNRALSFHIIISALAILLLGETNHFLQVRARTQENGLKNSMDFAKNGDAIRQRKIYLNCSEKKYISFMTPGFVDSKLQPITDLHSDLSI